IKRELEGKDLGDPVTALNALIEIRNKFRKEKNFALSDKIRDGLKEIGIILEDTKEGTKYRLEATNG
ncbi:MAG: hypothetical protein C0175_00440, partial [Caldisericum exile]